MCLPFFGGIIAGVCKLMWLVVCAMQAQIIFGRSSRSNARTRRAHMEVRTRSRHKDLVWKE
jgi:hypothetical protein